jgi:type IV fimbrial biogenesis protein FimT
MIELLVTISLAAIILAFAVPGMSGFLMRARLSTEASSLQADIAYARSEAVRQNTPVSLCPAAIGTTVLGPYACSGASDWSIGWISFVDPLGTGVFGAGSTLLRVHSTARLTSAMGTGGLAGAPAITIRPTGEASKSGGINFCMSTYPMNSLNLLGSGGASIATAAIC